MLMRFCFCVNAHAKYISLLLLYVFTGEMQLADKNNSYGAGKDLKPDVSSETRDDFKREVGIMSSLHHENILQLMGIVSVQS